MNVNSATVPRAPRSFTEATTFAVLARAAYASRGVIHLLIGLRPSGSPAVASPSSARPVLVARAVAFALIGVFILKAAIDYKPKEAVGIDGALARLIQHTYGTAALIVVARWLVTFGVYSLADARYRKI